ncbi:DUF2268 domain-containing putative Zn-dependent protease [Halomonas sp. CSM-2]|uniref:DUF2268 domain-containing putative Zn-dependent protease n=1 Tax=Halomonas sp. CSM-2 TaxID=1975722 RepID=UPI00159487E8|nr:DUF2268 domain-containing putative Zn-dependent protease [Halomonas sp. CSM-2]
METETEVRELLPELPSRICLVVYTGPGVIPEIGSAGSPLAPGLVSWTLDPSRPEGVLTMVHSHLRSTLFHEFHHLVRGHLITGGKPVSSFMEGVISEGLATAFERDAAGSQPLWGQYPPEVEAWVDELKSLPLSAPYADWMFRHPDGRRWIGYRAGTYLVDQAIAASDASAAQLVSVPAAEIIELTSRYR